MILKQNRKLETGREALRIRALRDNMDAYDKFKNESEKGVSKTRHQQSKTAGQKSHTILRVFYKFSCVGRRQKR